MPVFLAAIGGVLLNVTASMVGRALLALGLSVVTYTGITATITWAKTQALSSLSSLPAEALGVMSVLKIGEAISIVFSAILVRLLVSGLSSDTVKRWVTK
jgi:Protein of unknown function (DUF2523)